MASDRLDVPSVQGDLGGPVVEGARHKDFFGDACPAEHGGSGLCGRTLAVGLQVLLPGEKLLDLLRRLADNSTCRILRTRLNSV